MKKDTDNLKNQLSAAEDFDRFMKENRDSFNYVAVSEIFYRYLEESGMSKADLAKNSGMSEVYLYQILSGKRSPSRNRVIALCMGLALSLDETESVLKTSGNASLYVRNRRDAAIIFALQNRWSVYDLNEKLFEMGEETLF